MSFIPTVETAKVAITKLAISQMGETIRIEICNKFYKSPTHALCEAVILEYIPSVASTIIASGVVGTVGICISPTATIIRSALIDIWQEANKFDIKLNDD